MTPSGELRNGMRCLLQPGDVIGLGRTVVEVLGRRTDWLSSDLVVPADATLVNGAESEAGDAREHDTDSFPWSAAGTPVPDGLETELFRAPPSLPQTAARLTLLGPGTSETVDMNTSPFRIGRTPGPQVALVVRHDRLSSPHVEIRETVTGYEVMDLGSRNGTWVDGMRLAEHVTYPLRRHSLLRIGKLAALFTAEEDSPADTAVWERAAAMLVQEGSLSASDVDRARAATSSRRNLGEVLLVKLRSTLTVERWVHATERARAEQSEPTDEAPLGRSRSAWQRTQGMARDWWWRLAHGRKRDL
jgi:pSer/pThr/pTyr-binding forkhead associated (FHA) protein